MQFNYLAGRGVRGIVDGKDIVLGNMSLLNEIGITSGIAEQRADDLRSQGTDILGCAVCPERWQSALPTGISNRNFKKKVREGRDLERRI